MKIKKIEFENFRNFKDRGEIICSVDGRTTIIYGKNGDGKTTLHQLLQWVFYGKVKFNKTSSDNKLYNLAFESDCFYGQTFNVMGRVDFAHEGEEYSLTRTYQYRKELEDSTKIGEDVELLKMDSDLDWRRIDEAQKTIEKMLPSGLSEYFFFDGESMIADLRVKGKDSANKLRNALYSMFDLDILENAIDHIGREDLKTTVLGKLYLSKGSVANGNQVEAIKANINGAQNKKEKLEAQLNDVKKKKEKNQEIIQNVSEQIGGVKSKAEYEEQRKDLKNQRDFYLKNSASEKAAFGDAVMDMFPQLLISKAVDNAKDKLSLKAEESSFPTGLDRRLIDYLLSDSTKECICGAQLCDENRKRIAGYRNLLYPNSWVSTYNEFTAKAKAWGKEYDSEKLERCILMVLNNNEFASKCDREIHKLDEEEKKSKDIENLIIERQEAEEKVKTLEDEIVEISDQINNYTKYLNKQMNDFNKVTEETAESQKAERRMKIMNQVKEYFSVSLEEKSKEYSHKLEKNIQELLDDMLTSRRKVHVGEDFSVRVTDSFDDESKSEGQFAVVSFAYIGGILKMLKSETPLANKEYPLVLDGPFSKLDSEQRQNVVNKIPEFASQVILFSKDNLQEVFPKDQIGKVWTICSNEEKNIATIEEGFKWN